MANCLSISSKSSLYLYYSAIVAIPEAEPIAAATLAAAAAAKPSAFIVAASVTVVPTMAPKAGLAAPKLNIVATILAARAAPSTMYVHTFPDLSPFTFHACLYYSAEGSMFSDITTSLPAFFKSSLMADIVLLAISSHVVAFISLSDIISY
jgi:hypothetical protein